MNAKTASATITMVILIGMVTDLIINSGNARLSEIKTVASIFAGLRMKPFCCQSIMGLDRVGCVISQW